MAEKIDLEKCNFWKFRSSMTLTLMLVRAIAHAVVHQSSTSIYAPNFIEIGKNTFCGRMDVPTDGHFRPALMLLGRLRGVELKIRNFALFMHIKHVSNVTSSSIQQVSVKCHENKCKD